MIPHRREIAFDTETTGLEVADGHRIIDIGAVEIINGMVAGHFHVFLDPDREVDPDATKVHGKTWADLKGCPRFPEIVDELLEFIGDSPLVIHNAGFDIKFMNAELKAAGRPPLSNPVIDTLQEARKRFPRSPVSLDALCKRYKVDNSSRTLHGALLDATLLAEVYVKMMGTEGLGIVALAEEKASEVKQSVMAAQKSRSVGTIVRPERAYRGAVLPSEAEAEAHLQFLASLKDPVWQHYQ